jgi:hypothetical protein
MTSYARLTLAVLLAACAIGCSRKPERPCNGTVSAEAVAAAVPVIDAFRAHLSKMPVTNDIDRFLSDYRHYALSITTTESQYVFEFVPRDEGRGFKGGGACYKVDRASGKIDEEMFMK